jgi:asparagine synthase (glutamine-hydrolysing)
LQRAGLETTALTFGQASDMEMRCARQVARALGMPQLTTELDTSRYEEYARIHTTWDHCAAGSSLLMDWGLAEHMSAVPGSCVTGLGLDWVLGGHAPTVPNLSFEKFFAYQNVWGLAPPVLRSLLRRDVFGDLVFETMTRIEAAYCSYSDTEWRRAWSFSLRHRNRFHIGSEAWRISFGAWPIVPAGDAALIELGGALPPASAADRRAQYELLKTRFPKLAALPLDRNSPDMTPLSPGLGWLLSRPLIDPAIRVRDAVKRRLGGATERRRYYRIFDINSPGWTKIRRLAEPYRTLGYEFFEAKALDELWPPPDIPVVYRDGITDVASIKTILGFLIWAHDHVSG